jgi:glutamate-ammonia-ligase adenylyltransferase
MRLLEQFKDSPKTRALSQIGRNRIDRLIPIVIEAVSVSASPDMALKRILQLIDTIQRRTTYIALLLENPNALQHLIRLANASSWVVSFLAQHPVLLDELIDPRTLYSPPERAFCRMICSEGWKNFLRIILSIKWRKCAYSNRSIHYGSPLPI